MRKALFYSLVVLRICYVVNGQPYLEKQTQHRFAQTYFGLNSQVSPAQGSFIWNEQSHSFPTITTTQLTIGGLHFWGKLDFNFSIPIFRILEDQLDEETDLFLSPGGDLNVRYYPWRLIYGKPRPYAGVSVNATRFGIENREAGERYDSFLTSSFLAGIAFAKKGWQVNAELAWRPNTQREFYSGRNSSETLRLPRSYFSFGLVKYVDFTLGDEKDKESGRTEAVFQELSKRKKLNSLSIGIAPTSAFFLQSPRYSDPDRASLPDHKGEFAWEFGVGYLFQKQGLHLGLSYRDYTSSVESYGLQHLLRRTSIALEGLIFLWDYNGFVPFVGPSISYERWSAGEFAHDQLVGDLQRTRVISPGFVFGWDIVPTSIDTWTLRTNLRYYPFQRVVNATGTKSRVDQFEFNFIELVIYPSRMIHVAKVKKKF